MIDAHVLPFPLSLILLVHLHLLEYPHANKPEYDHNIFEPRVRGLRDRTQSMEDVSYFLVSCVEGKRDGARSILPSYPCIQPSDTVAFRTALSRYLEDLKHKAIFLFKPLGAEKGKGQDTGDIAWWWKDAMVRKSLLEECSGLKFERLLLSLSTHALFLQSKKPVEPIHILLRSLPVTYAGKLAQFQFEKILWTRAALALEERLGYLKSLCILSRKNVSDSKYASQSTERLLILANHYREDLVKKYWNDKERRRAFQFIIELAGLKASEPPANEKRDISTSLPIPIGLPPGLPVAAAHHPSHMKRIGRRIFDSRVVTGLTSTHSTNESILKHLTMFSLQAKIVLSDHKEIERRMLRTLSDTVSRTRKVNYDIAIRVNSSETFARLKEGSREPNVLEMRDSTWSQSFLSFDFHPVVNDELLSSFSLQIPGAGAKLENRIHDIRTNVLPSYPPLHTPSFPSLRTPDYFSCSVVSTRRRNERDDHLVTPPLPLTAHTAHKGHFHLHSQTSIPFSLSPTNRSHLGVVDDSPFLPSNDSLENEVSRLVLETFDTSNEDSTFKFDALTLIGRRKPVVNRIYTAGTPGKRAVRESSLGPEGTLMALDTFKEILEANEDSLDGTEITLVGKKMSAKRYGNQVGFGEDNSDPGTADGEEEGGGEDEEWRSEGPSIMIRDILLGVEAMQFDLLEGQNHDDDDASLDWE